MLPFSLRFRQFAHPPKNTTWWGRSFVGTVCGWQYSITLEQELFSGLGSCSAKTTCSFFGQCTSEANPCRRFWEGPFGGVREQVTQKSLLVGQLRAPWTEKPISGHLRRTSGSQKVLRMAVPGIYVYREHRKALQVPGNHPERNDEPPPPHPIFWPEGISAWTPFSAWSFGEVSDSDTQTLKNVARRKFH